MADGVINFNTKIDTEGVDKGTAEISSKVLNLKNKIANTEAEAKRLNQELEEMADKPVDTTVSDSIKKKLNDKLVEIKEVQKELGEADNQIISRSTSNGVVDEKGVEWRRAHDTHYLETQKKLQSLNAEYDRYLSELKNAETTENKVTGKNTGEYRKKQQRLQELNGKLNVYKVQLKETEQKEKESARQTSKSADTIKTLCNAVKKATQRLGEFVKNGTSKFASGLKSIFNGSKKANSQMGVLGKTLKRIEQMIVGMVFYKVIQGGIQAIGEALGTLSKESPIVNKQLSALMTSLTYLKNSLVSVFAPILTVVTPILTKFMDIISAAANKVANFIAVLSGQSSYQKAVKVQQDYAKSLDDTAKSTKNLAKENERGLASFDELNVMQDNSSNSDSANTDTAAVNYFQTIPTVFEGFADKLKKAFSKGNYKAIGQLVADKLNSAMKSIKWNKIRSTAKSWANNIVGFLNGFINKFNWKSFGKTLGNGIMTVVDFAYTFVDKFKWGKFGQAIHDAFINIFKTINFKKVRNAFVKAVNGLVTMTLKAIGKPDFSAFGTNTAQGLIDTLKKIDWRSISNLFTTLVVGALDFVDGFVLSINWVELGNNIATSFKTFFGKGGKGFTILSKMAQTLSDILFGVFTTLDNITNAVNWEEFGSNLAKGFKIDTSDKAWQNVLAKTAGDIVDAVLGFINGFLGDQSTADELAVGIETMLNNVPWKKILINALSALINVGSWLINLAGDLVDDFCKGLATGFSNAEDNTELNKAIDGLGRAIGNLFITAIEALCKILVNAIPNFIVGLGKTAIDLLAQPLRLVLGEEWYSGVSNDLWGENSFKFDIPVNIPRLASGMYVPANYGEFLAVLGDNKQEPEVISPLSTMKQAFLEAMTESGFSKKSNDTPIILTLSDGTVLFNAVAAEDDKYTKRHGHSRFARR